MNTMNNQADMAVSDILAGLLPVIADEVKASEGIGGAAPVKLESALKGVQAVYETTTISDTIKFSQIRDSVKNVAEAMVEYCRAVGAFQQSQKLAA